MGPARRSLTWTGTTAPIGKTTCLKGLGASHIMRPGNLLVEAWEVVPVLLLFLIGVAIAIPSGIRHLGSIKDFRQLGGNLAGVLLRLIAYLAAMFLVHDWIGLRPILGW